MDCDAYKVNYNITNEYYYLLGVWLSAHGFNLTIDARIIVLLSLSLLSIFLAICGPASISHMRYLK